jgi:hypothetical protein
VFGLLDVGMQIVVTEVPVLVCVDGLEASWADRRLTALDPASRLLPETAMGDAIALPLDAVLHQPPPSLVRALDLASFRSTSTIRRNHALSLDNRGEKAKGVGCWRCLLRKDVFACRSTLPAIHNRTRPSSTPRTPDVIVTTVRLGR